MADDRLSWFRFEVDGRSATYGAGGDGPPVVFLHGWALGSRAYKRAVRRLMRRGCRVYAPSMPGFGGTADLPGPSVSIADYAGWTEAFMDAVGIGEPALVVGHSFGGGVAIKLAQTYPDRVGYLVLLNSVGVATNRPVWEWALRLGGELLPTRQGIETMRAMRDDFVANLVRNPLGLIRAGELARKADLRDELAELRERGLPVLALMTTDDGVIPRTAFEALCNAVGTDGRLVSGRHSWLLADPDSFDEVLANVVEVRVADHRAAVATSRAADVADALRDTKVPRRVVGALLRDAPPLWLMSASPTVLAGDLALCHPTFGRDEVRAVARQMHDPNTFRLTVVAADRRGLLADTAGVLGAHGLSIAAASAATWPKRGIALHSLTITDAAEVEPTTWERLGHDLRAVGAHGGNLRPAFEPSGRASVTINETGADHTLVRIAATDQIGLLSAICRWFADHGVSIESLHATTEDGNARDVLVVTGPFDASVLARHLSGGAAGTASGSIRATRHRERPVTVKKGTSTLQL
jgi:pimeloyl-ACP methyl ester carboxylesterase/glycine cleavage system regulatory protein